MPSIALNFGQAGPLVQVVIGLSVPHRDALQKAGKALPAPVTGTFLIDTGASGTCVDPNFVAPLGLIPTGSVTIQTPSTNGSGHVCHQYDVSLIIPNGNPAANPLVIDAMPIMETALRSQGIDGLIGRDVLSLCSFHAHGPFGMFVLSY
jgi:hypothetical protein